MAVVVAVAAAVVVALLGGASGSQVGPTRVVATIQVGGAPCVAIGVGRHVLASTNRASVVRIDPRRNRVVGPRIAVGNWPCGLAAGAGSLWVDTFGENLVERVNLRTGKVVKRIRV